MSDPVFSFTSVLVFCLAVDYKLASRLVFQLIVVSLSDFAFVIGIGFESAFVSISSKMLIQLMLCLSYCLLCISDFTCVLTHLCN